MNKQLIVWQLASKSLRESIPVMLLYVLESSGSSPGRQGFFMVVNAAGEMEGSIGGGIMEHKFVEMAKEKLSSNNVLETIVKKQIHDKSVAKNQSGMICSGEQTIVLYELKKEEITQIQEIIACLEQNKNGILKLSPNSLSFSNEVFPQKNFNFDFKSENEWFYEEKIGYKNHLYIIGGGHCALALSKIMSTMDFNIHLFDDRSELNTFLKNDFVHEKTIVNDYNELKNLITGGINQYVAIMTVGYRTDDIALRVLIDKNFRYLGLLGSKTKVKKLLNDFQETGFSQEKLEKIHSPIGIQIKSETPEEIAISIAAEIIQVKNNTFS